MALTTTVDIFILWQGTPQTTLFIKIFIDNK